MKIKQLIFRSYYYYNKHFPINKGKSFISNVLNAMFGLFWVKVHNYIYLHLYINSSMDLSYLGENHSHNIVISEINNLHDGDVFVDVGANIGYLSIYASGKVGANGHIYSFEPSYREYKRLIDNIEKNQVNNILAYNSAVGDENKTIKLKIEKRHTGLNKIVLQDSLSENCKTINIPLVKLDDIIKDKKIDLVKIDVEGAELFVLLGMKNLLSRKAINKIIVEITPKFLSEFNTQKEEIYSLLKENGYLPRYNHDLWQYDEVFELGK